MASHACGHARGHDAAHAVHPRRWSMDVTDPLLGGPPSPSSSSKARVLTPLGLACMAFMCVCAGPYGIEDAVGAAGALPVLVACLLLPVVWGLPQAMITAELSTMMDENGGYVLWVRRGLGNFWGWMSSYNSVGSNLCDLPLYAVLLSEYVGAYVRRTFHYDLSSSELWSIKAFALLFIGALNVRGVSSVSAVSFLITLIIVLPFLIEPVMPDVHLDAHEWTTTTPTINWSLFVSTMLWNFQGWDGLGCVAGEVKDGKRTYPLGVLFALVVITFAYTLPVMVGVCVIPDLSAWQSGLLETIASKISPWLGVWVVIGAALSNVGEFNVVMCNSARALWAMAQRKMVPPVLGWEWQRYDTPVAAIAFQFVTTGVLMTFGFSELVVLDTFFNNVSLLLESASFITLRYTEPDSDRPFRVPGGLIGAWCCTLPKFAIIMFGLGTAGTQAWLYCGVANVVFALLYVLRNRLVAVDDPSNIMDSAKSVASSTSRPSEDEVPETVEAGMQIAREDSTHHPHVALAAVAVDSPILAARSLTTESDPRAPLTGRQPVSSSV